MFKPAQFDSHIKNPKPKDFRLKNDWSTHLKKYTRQNGFICLYIGIKHDLFWNHRRVVRCFFFRFLCAMHFGTCHQRWFGSSHWINIRQLSYILPHQHRTWTLSWFPLESEVLTVDLAGCFYIFIIFPPERNWQGNMAQNHWCVTLNHWIWQDLFSTVHLADLFELAVSDQIQGWDALCLVSLVI